MTLAALGIGFGDGFVLLRRLHFDGGHQLGVGRVGASEAFLDHADGKIGRFLLLFRRDQLVGFDDFGDRGAQKLLVFLCAQDGLV